MAAYSLRNNKAFNLIVGTELTKLWSQTNMTADQTFEQPFMGKMIHALCFTISDSR